MLSSPLWRKQKTTSENHRVKAEKIAYGTKVEKISYGEKPSESGEDSIQIYRAKASRRLQDAPRDLQERPRLQQARKTHGFSTCSESNQIAFKRAPRRSKRLQDASKTPPRRPPRRSKTLQDAAKTLQDGSKTAPRRLQNAPRRLQDATRRSKTLPNRRIKKIKCDMMIFKIY
jgi:hypothetical protein